MADKDEEKRTVLDSEGNEFTQRPFNIDDAPPPIKKRAGRRVKVISVYQAKQFLTDGTIEYLEEKQILESDFKQLGDRVRKIA